MYARRRRRHLLCVHFVKVTESVPSTMGNRGCCCYLSVPVEILPPRTRLPSSCSPTCTPRNNAPRLHFRSRSRLSPTVRAPVSPSRTLSASRSLTNRFRFAREKWRNTSAEPRRARDRLPFGSGLPPLSLSPLLSSCNCSDNVSSGLVSDASFEIRLCREVVIYISFVFPCFYASVLYTTRLTSRFVVRRSIYIYIYLGVFNFSFKDRRLKNKRRRVQKR